MHRPLSLGDVPGPSLSPDLPKEDYYRIAIEFDLLSLPEGVDPERNLGIFKLVATARAGASLSLRSATGQFR